MRAAADVANAPEAFRVRRAVALAGLIVARTGATEANSDVEVASPGQIEQRPPADAWV